MAAVSREACPPFSESALHTTCNIVILTFSANDEAVILIYQITSNYGKILKVRTLQSQLFSRCNTRLG